MAAKCGVPSLAMEQGSVESGRRPNANALVSAMPVINGKTRARIRAIFFMAISLHHLWPEPAQFDRECFCQNQLGAAVTVITYYRNVIVLEFA